VHSLAARSMVVVGVLLLVGALVAPWMEVPSGFEDRADGKLICSTIQPRVALPVRAVCGCLAVAIVVGHLKHQRTGQRKAMLAASALTILLFFPTVVMNWEPSFSARVNWLQIQHENLTWFGGDVSTNLEYGRKSWKDRVYLVDTPRQINVVRMPNSGLGAFQAGRLSVWFDTLGYSEGFCQFARRGWFAAVLGATLLVMGECLPAGRLSHQRARLSILASLGTGLVGLLVVSLPVVIASRRLERARRMTALGQLDKAESYLRGAIRILPALREDTFFVAQLGLLDHRRGRDGTPEGQLFLANLLERQGRYAQANAIYATLLVEEPEGSAIRREANRALLRDAGYAMNIGRPEDAIRRLESVLAEEPCSLKLAYLRTGRRDDLTRMVRRIEATYAQFPTPTKEIVLAQSHENEMFAAVKAGDMDATFRHSIGAKKP
jgi:tetratricopeptide (TPR) repeat protein